FDPIGRLRSVENGKPVDTSGQLIFSSASGAFSSSTDLIERIAASDDVRSCFARHVFRFASARPSAADEEAFLAVWQVLPEPQRSNPRDILLAYVESASFTTRSTP